MTPSPSNTLDPWGFSTFGDPELVKLLDSAKTYAGNLPAAGWLALLGNSGTGKTHLARRLVKLWNARHIYDASTRRVRYGAFCEWSRLLKQLRDGQRDALDAAGESGLLVIDDVGAESGTSYADEQLLMLLNLRRNRPTVVTGNLSLGDLAARNDRAASRIAGGGVVVNVEAAGYHLRKDAPQANLAPSEPTEDEAPMNPIQSPAIAAVARRIASKFKA